MDLKGVYGEYLMGDAERIKNQMPSRRDYVSEKRCSSFWGTVRCSAWLERLACVVVSEAAALEGWG